MLVQLTLVAALVFVMADLSHNAHSPSSQTGLNTEMEEAIPIPPPPPSEDKIPIIVDDVEIVEDDVEMEEMVEEQQDDPVYTIVEEMPAFPGCEDQPKSERERCTQREIANFLGQNLVYPQAARKAGLEGTAYLSFVVAESGQIMNVEVIRGVNGAKTLDDEAVRLVSTLPNFIPGKQRGKEVKVKYVIPIKFVLTEDK